MGGARPQILAIECPRCPTWRLLAEVPRGFTPARGSRPRVPHHTPRRASRRRRTRSLHGRPCRGGLRRIHLSRRSLLNNLTTARFWSPAGQSSELFERPCRGGRHRSAHVRSGVVRQRRSRPGCRSRRVRGRPPCRSIGMASPSKRRPATSARASAILACGANYSLHRQVGLGMPRMFLHTAQIELPAQPSRRCRASLWQRDCAQGIWLGRSGRARRRSTARVSA